MAKIKEVVSDDKLQQALDHLNKAYGIGTVLTLNGKVRDKYDVISSGSIGIDFQVLGVGGWIIGRLYELMGWEGSGKTTICGHAIAECQKAGKVAMCIDGEHAVDKDYFEALGVDTNKLLFAQPSNGEEGFQIAKEMIMSGKIDLLIIDSDSSMIPKCVLEGDMGDSSIGKKARLNNGAYPALKSLLVQHKVCVIVVSQFREKIGVMFGNPTTTQGGHALKFYSDCRIEVSKSVAKDGDESYGNITKIKTTKNKTFSPYKKCEFDVVWGVGIDKVKEIVDIGVELKIIQKSGSWFSYGETKIGQGINGVSDLLNDNPELTEEIRAKIIEKITATDIPVEKLKEVINEI